MHHIVTQYMLLVEKVSNTIQQSNSFNTDVDIYRSEIHIIQLIGDSSEIYISEISRIIGITKATVSQIVKRLEKKGLVSKHLDTQNNTRQVINLTKKGQIAYQAHAKMHHDKHKLMNNYLDTLDQNQIETIKTFLCHADSMLDEHL